jgi:hypothetical protein
MDFWIMSACALLGMWRSNYWMKKHTEDTKIVLVEKVGKNEKHQV